MTRDAVEPWRPTRREVLAGAMSLTALAACGGSNDAVATATTTTATTAGGTATATTTGAPATAAGTYLPPATGEWAAADPAATGWSQARLDKLGPAVGDANSRTFMMLAGGRILLESYFAGATADTLQDIASCQKSVTSTLIGIAHEKGILDIDQHVSEFLAPGWSKATPAQEAAITVRHVMTMSSGLNPTTLRKVDEPGARWDYNTAIYQKLRRVLEAAAGDDINHLSRAWMFDTIGIGASVVWQERPDVPEATDATGEREWGLLMTARDMARFGLLALRKGTWGETQVVSRDWLESAWRSSPVKVDYGLLWWLLGKGNRGGANAPDDWVAGLGAQDQKVYVVPSLDLVATRQGTAAREASDNTSSFDATLMRGILATRA
jgi:CubicO group peptidase (beta-lactamase class C family)